MTQVAVDRVERKERAGLTSSQRESIRRVDSRVSSVTWLDLNCSSCKSDLGSADPSPMFSCKVQVELGSEVEAKEVPRRGSRHYAGKRETQ